MINDILQGIITAIRTKYDTTYNIYTESIEQGLKEPCFFILPLSGDENQSIGDRVNRNNLYRITYFPVSKDEPRYECMQVLESLFDILSLITLSMGKLHGSEMSGEIVDDLLQFGVTYNYSLLANETSDLMEDHITRGWVENDY